MIHFRICESFSIFFQFSNLNPRESSPSFAFLIPFGLLHPFFIIFFIKSNWHHVVSWKPRLIIRIAWNNIFWVTRKKKRARYHHIILEWKKFIASLFLVAIHDSNKNWFTNWFTTQKGQKPLTVGDKIFCPFDGVSLINYS